MHRGTCLCGATGWAFDGTPEDATICNCSACRRYGTLWAYDWEGERITVRGETVAWKRPHERAVLTFNHCPDCGCVVFWRALGPGEDGRVRIAVNLRLAEAPEPLMGLPLLKFDGLHSFEDLDPEGRRLGDVWW